MIRVTIIFFLMLVANCFSQNKQILYNLTSTPQSMLSNPGADVSYSWFVGVPLLSGLSTHVGSSGFSLHDLFANDGIDFNSKLRNMVSSISRNDKISLNQQLEIFNGGFKVGDWQDNSYLSFGLYQETDLLLYIPRDYAILALDGNQNHLGKVFNVGDLNMRAEMLSVFHMGFHKKVNEKLVLGARAKIYSSIFNITSTQNSGFFYTIQGSNSVYNQVISVNAMVNASGFSNSNEYDARDAQSDIIKRVFLGGNLGLGLDLGLTYYPKKNLQLTASLNDIGFISHTKDLVNYSWSGFYNHIGLQPNFTTGSTSNIIEEFNNAIPLDTTQKRYRTNRPLKFNSSIQYSFGDGRKLDCNCTGEDQNRFTNSLGAQLFVMSAPRAPLAAITAYYRRQVFNSLEMKATYTVDSFSARNLGLGFSTTLGRFNFYLLADNLLEYADISKANALSFQLGFNIIFPDKNAFD